MNSQNLHPLIRKLNVKGIILKFISIFCVLVKCQLFYSSGCFLSKKTLFLGEPYHIWIEWQPWKWFSKRPKMSAKMSGSSYSVLAPVCGTAGCRPVQTASDWLGPGNHLTTPSTRAPSPVLVRRHLVPVQNIFALKVLLKFLFTFLERAWELTGGNLTWSNCRNALFCTRLTSLPRPGCSSAVQKDPFCKLPSLHCRVIILGCRAASVWCLVMKY